MNEYEQKKADKAERFRQLAEKNKTAAAATWEKGRDMASVIPLGQPILVGHHSEGRDRRYRDRIQGTYQRAHDLEEKAKYYANKADNAANNTAISSDDPEAITKLKEKLAAAEENGAKMRAFNKCMRKKDNAGMLALGFPQGMIDELIKPDFCGRLGFADYQMSNNNGNIATMKKRIARLESWSHDTTTEREAGGIKIVDNVEINRLQLLFPGKPSAEVRSLLKHAGFRWAPSEGAWQRQRSNNATYAANQVIEKINKGELK